MNARRAARELALLSFSQISRNPEKWEDKDIEDIIINSIRTLLTNAESELKKAIGYLLETKEFIENYEIEHSENAKMPIGSSIIPVPLTSDITGKVNLLIDAADKTLSAMDITELFTLSNKREVKDYTLKLITLYLEHKKDIDSQIDKLSIGWNINRLVKIDRDILRIATAELLYISSIPVSVAIDEAVELAKEYSTDESSGFINGILRQVVEENKLRKTKAREEKD